MKRLKLLAATGNKNKLFEFERILSPLGIEVLPPDAAGVDAEVEETGETFAENARIKAAALHAMTGLPVIADDSGLCVDALGGRPGVHSKRYMDSAPPKVQIAGLLKEMENIPGHERTARFVAAICCILDDNTAIEVEESCEGEIAYEPSGDGGFGYDPVFLMDGKSFGDASDEEKDRKSHRGKALRTLVEKLKLYMDKEIIDDND